MPPAAPDGLLSGEGRDRELSSDVVSLPPAPDTPDDQLELGQLTGGQTLPVPRRSMGTEPSDCLDGRGLPPKPPDDYVHPLRPLDGLLGGGGRDEELQFRFKYDAE